jgi:hypothetical protein
MPFFHTILFIVCVSTLPFANKQVVEDSAADLCGLVFLGDRVLAVNGKKMSHNSFNSTVKAIKASGGSMRLDVITDPHVHTVMLKREYPSDNFGVEFTAESGWLVVGKVLEGAAADQAGVLRGDRIFDINGLSSHGVSNVETMRIVLNTCIGAAAVTLYRAPQKKAATTPVPSPFRRLLRSGHSHAHEDQTAPHRDLPLDTTDGAGADADADWDAVDTSGADAGSGVDVGADANAEVSTEGGVGVGGEMADLSTSAAIARSNEASPTPAITPSPPPRRHRSTSPPSVLVVGQPSGVSKEIVPAHVFRELNAHLTPELTARVKACFRFNITQKVRASVLCLCPQRVCVLEGGGVEVNNTGLLACGSMHSTTSSPCLLCGAVHPHTLTFTTLA